MIMVTTEIHLKGTPISRGIAIGKALFLMAQNEAIPNFQLKKEDVEKEILRYRKAVSNAATELDVLLKQLQKDGVFEGVAILESCLHMMQDPLLTENVERKIRIIGKNAEFVFQMVIHDYQLRFAKVTDPFFRERFKDVQDISKRVLAHLKSSFRLSLAHTPANSVIFSYDLSATDAAEANASYVSAFVSDAGGVTSHAAIVAKAKGIPYVTNIAFKGLESYSGATIIVDGRTGDVYLNPSEKRIERYLHLKNVMGNHLKKLSVFSHNIPETYDGYTIRISANIEMVNEVSQLHQYGNHSVGLFRSEYEFLAHENFPSEDEQFLTYRRAVEMMNGQPIVIRTFDVGGDKKMMSASIFPETNPIMGCRAIRFLLQRRDLFKSQIRAILRASIAGDVSILFPLVSSLSELLEAKELLKEVEEELVVECIPFTRNIRVGCMIEVPSAAIIADLLAKECDFLSIGTNDLVQYSLAVDRGNQQISCLYTPTHPSVIRLIKLVVQEANHEGIPVTICGEIAANPQFTALLLGLGVHELSVAPLHISMITHAVRSSSIVEATALAEYVLSLASAAEIHQVLCAEYQRMVPEDCFYNV